MSNSPDSSDLPSDNNGLGHLNSLRAAVLGANDGIVSTSSVVMGVAGATSSHHAIVTAGLAALVAGALSMAVGEYVSVSSQADAELAYINDEKHKLRVNPDKELDGLAREYQKLGVSKSTARKVAEELTARDALTAHLRIHFNIDPDNVNSPWQAAVASLLSFTVGGLIPFITILLVADNWRIMATVVSVLLALALTGYLSAKAGGAHRGRAVARVIAGGALAMLITYYVGHLFGAMVG